jgi:hypothetical protein
MSTISFLFNFLSKVNILIFSSHYRGLVYLIFSHILKWHFKSAFDQNPKPSFSRKRKKKKEQTVRI